MTKQEALAEIASLVSQAEALISKAEEIAKENQVEFYMSLGGIGMGGTYGEDWESSDEWDSSDEETSTTKKPYVWRSSNGDC
jgi:hypothetical protein